MQDWAGLQDDHRGRRVHGPVAARGPYLLRMNPLTMLARFPSYGLRGMDMIRTRDAS